MGPLTKKGTPNKRFRVNRKGTKTFPCKHCGHASTAELYAGWQKETSGRWARAWRQASDASVHDCPNIDGKPKA